MKISLSLSDVLLHPKSASETAFKRAFNTDLDPWVWLQIPEHAPMLAVFNSSMEATQSLGVSDIILEGKAIVVKNIGSGVLIMVQVSTGKG